MKNARRKFTYVLTIVLLSICLMSCSKEDTPESSDLVDEIGNLQGFGDMSGTPQGSSFSLPEGITLVSGITGGWCETPTFVIGSGLLVSVCFELRNSTDKEISVNFPAGLVLLSKTDNYQHGVVLRTETIRIPANTTVRISLYTYCGNSGRSGSDADASYTFGPISHSKLIMRLINDLNGKKIDISDYWDDENDTYVDDYLFEQTNVQTLLWMITEGRELKDWQKFEMAYQELLKQIPSKK